MALLPHPTLRRLHRWLGVIVGLPCLLWGTSGAVLAWKRLAPPPAPLPARAPDAPFLVSAEEALRLTRRAQPLSELRRAWLAGQPRYELRYGTDLVVLDGRTAQLVPALDAAAAARLAAALSGAACQGCARAAPGLIFRGDPARPALRCRLASGDDLYLAIDSGEVLALVDQRYRLLRVSFFALHLWELPATRSFSPLVLAAMALLLVLTGTSGLLMAARARR